MDILYNMSGPPRSYVSYEIKRFGKQLLFDPDVLIKLLNTDKTNLIKKIEQYCELNNSIYTSSKRPKGYMVGKIPSEIDKDYIVVEDIDLLILVLGSTFGNMYVPNKELLLSESRFKNKILFLEEEVYS